MTICSQLGYTTDDLEPVLDPTRALQANSLMTQLDAIDSAIAGATLDSMAVAVGDLRVDYSRHLALLKTEGSRLLRQLAKLAGFSTIAYDRFSEKSDISLEATATVSPWSVQSYW